MPRTRINFSVEGVFVGPAPATGYHFMDREGFLHNESEIAEASGFINLVYPIHRIQSFGYDITVDRTKIVGLGKMGTMANKIIETPSVALNFSYYNVGVLNESRLGMYVNFYDPYAGSSVFPNNWTVCLISGFLTRNKASSTASINNWPRDYRDCRNIFVGVARQKRHEFNYRPINDIDVLGFGNCYMTSWRTSAAVGDFPKTDVSYISEHLKYYSSGSEITIPAVDVQTYSGINSVKCTIPSGNQDILPSVILPGDITVSLSGYNSDFGPDLQNLAIQAYTISMDLNREPLTTLGYRSPLDRVVRLPVFVNMSFEVALNDLKTGSIANLFRADTDYNIDITMTDTRYRTSGNTTYAFRKAKFTDYSSQNTVGGNRSARFNFETELDPEDLTKGLFISGFLGQLISGYNVPFNPSEVMLDVFHYIEFDSPSETGILKSEQDDLMLIEMTRIPRY